MNDTPAIPPMSPMARIWFIINMIPKGQVSSYGKIADLAGLPGRARFVSKALKSAPDDMQLPWYRVVNSQGKISFQADSAEFRTQMALLRTEGVEVNRGRIPLAQFEWRPDMATLILSMPF